MQHRKTHAERRAETKRKLVSAARQLFAAQGYAATSTPDIVAAAGVTRGALYHHYADKLALFEAVVLEEQLLVSMAINAVGAGDDQIGPVKALVAIGDAFLDTMQDSGRRQILLVDAPAVLGRERLEAIRAVHGPGALAASVSAAMEAKAIRDLPAAALTHLLTALFDQAAQATAAEAGDYRKTIKALIRGLRT